MKRIGFLAVCSAFALAAQGCGDDGRGDPDGGGIVLDDSGPGTDAGPGTDSGPTGTDAGDPVAECDRVGVGCMPDRGCVSGECQDKIEYDVGGPTDPVTGHPEGEDTIEVGSYFPGGYCTPSPIAFVDGGGCDPDAEMSCGECASCLFLGQQMGRDLSMCFKNCEPSMTENTCPQDTEQCLLGTGVCLWGCDSDDLCAIYRDDTNGNGEIDPYDAAMNPGGDNLVYDTEGMWTCNTTTRRCEHVAPEGASGGDPCTLDRDCENYGRCLDELSYEDWPGGYCIKSGCDTPGNECGGTGVCDERAFGFPVCLGPCEVASSNVMDDPATTEVDESLFGRPTACRDGYACSWNGVDGAGADNGVCVPGNYNEVRTANIGAACDSMGDGTECYSPFGLGACRDWDGADGPAGGSCTMFGCGAPGVPDDICGTNALCAGVTGTASTICLQTCTDASECGAGLGCWDTTMAGIMTGGMAVCFSGCLEDTHCRTGETCVGATAMSLGTCTAS